MKIYLLTIKFILWMPIVFISASIYFVLYLLNSVVYHVLKFIADNTFKNFTNDMRKSGRGTILEKIINESIKKYEDEEE